MNFQIKRYNGSDYEDLYPKCNLANVTGTLGVGNGGTGADNAADAKRNLNVADVRTETYAGDLNNIGTAGFYRINASQPNAPQALEWSQIIMLYDGTSDTRAQLGIGFSNGDLLYRGMSNGGGWTQWKTAVPTSRTINEKALSGNISLSASDVGAAPSSHTHNYAGSDSPGGWATNANYASSANYANSAGSATNATNATSADSATVAYGANKDNQLNYTTSVLRNNQLVQKPESGEPTITGLSNGEICWIYE